MPDAMTSPLLPPSEQSSSLEDQFTSVRAFTEQLCETLEPEDCCLQAMPDASPTRWHLAHTTWFFEQFLLAGRAGYRPLDQRYAYLFNSYYNTVGAQFPRANRGTLSRPTVREIYAYRQHVDAAVASLLVDERDGLQVTQSPADQRLRDVLILGLHHEQQHQELILTDIKYALACNPLAPVFRAANWVPAHQVGSQRWLEFEGGLVEIGHEGSGFAYDNESPRHRVYLEPYQLADRLVTNGEYLEFLRDGGYQRPELWLSEGWQWVQAQALEAPLYWNRDEESGWSEFTSVGRVPVDLNRPVCHVSFFEADAYARWAGAQLPTEAQWEHAAAAAEHEAGTGGRASDSFVDALIARELPIHPTGVDPASATRRAACQLYGNAWQWTSSPYTPYPGYRPAPGALGEYNGKFMCNQYVLRGGSCATHSTHIRRTYRNFFPATARWQFAGIRLAR
jgi:ergothioneine biosynthesis protein EgtB